MPNKPFHPTDWRRSGRQDRQTRAAIASYHPIAPFMPTITNFTDGSVRTRLAVTSAIQAATLRCAVLSTVGDVIRALVTSAGSRFPSGRGRPFRSPWNRLAMWQLVRYEVHNRKAGFVICVGWLCWVFRNGRSVTLSHYISCRLYLYYLCHRSSFIESCAEVESKLCRLGWELYFMITTKMFYFYLIIAEANSFWSAEMYKITT